MGNTFGKNIRLTTFGESHGPAIGGILDGMPPCVHIDFDRVAEEMKRRTPGRSQRMSARKETDEVEFLSGISGDGRTLGTPIGFIIRNQDMRPEDYKDYSGRFRLNHADYTYYKKYGIHAFEGGGRASARETACRVAAGALCRQWLEKERISVEAHYLATNPVEEALDRHDSTGGIVEGRIEGLPVGLGEPIYDKFHARLAEAMMGINAAKAFEYGDGFAAASAWGSESMDRMVALEDNEYRFETNHSGGVQGGITNGMPVEFKVYFKPTPTLMQPMKSYDIEGNEVTIPPKGRHDPCVALRAVPVVEAMALLTVADFMRGR